MKYLSFICLIFLMANLGFSQNQDIVYKTIRIEAPPKIDGNLNDEAWQNAPVMDNFTQNVPNEGKPVSQKTEVKIVYDNNAIYIGAMLYDNHPDSILRELGVRDAVINADKFGLAFDTYNNQQDAYQFEVYASGVQADLKVTDPMFDAVWESKTQIMDKGWCVEMKIPYSAIRFPSQSVHEWGMQVFRIIERKKESAQWVLVPKNVSTSLFYWGKLQGISNIKPPLRLSITPFVSTYFEHAPSINDQTSYNKTFIYSFGADLKYGINEKFTLDMTLLPDFSQVQSDNKVKNLGYQEIIYNENRSFFKEGIDLFNKNKLFYSRRIGGTPGGYSSLESQLTTDEKIISNPSKVKLLNAIKLSGRNNNKLGIGVFNAITDNTYAEVENSNGEKRRVLTEPLTNYNVIVFDQQLRNNSSGYLINTNVWRDKTFKHANVTASGFTLQNKSQSYAIDAKGILSQKFSKNDTISNTFNDLLGYKYEIHLRKASGKFQYGYLYRFINKSFDTRDMGVYEIGNLRLHCLWVGYYLSNPNKWFRAASTEFAFDRFTNPITEKIILGKFMLDHASTFLNYSSISLHADATPINSLDYNEPRVDGRYSIGFKYYNVDLGMGTDSRRDLRFTIHFMHGDYLAKYNGKLYGIYPVVQYRINDKSNFSYGVKYIVDNNNIGFVEAIDNNNIIYGGRKIQTWESILNFQFVIKNDMDIKFNARYYWNTGKYLRYYDLLENGNIQETTNYPGNKNFSYSLLNIDLVYSWQFAPGSILSIAYKNYIEKEEQLISKNASKNFRSTLDYPQTNSFSLKLVYYLDYQNIVKRKSNLR